MSGGCDRSNRTQPRVGIQGGMITEGETFRPPFGSQYWPWRGTETSAAAQMV